MGHYGDVAIITPIFHGGAVVAFAASTGHTADMGGSLKYLASRDAYEGAFHIPPLKMYSGGRIDETFELLLRANVRVPDDVMGDIAALVAGNLRSVQLVREFLDEYGFDSLSPLADALAHRGESAMREYLRSVPDGVYRSEVTIDGAREPLQLKIALTVRDGSVVVDFAGSPQQLEVGGVNVPMSMTRCETVYALMMLLVPGITEADGVARCVETVPKRGRCSTRGSRPRRGRIVSASFIHTALSLALAGILPHAVQAGTGHFQFKRLWGQTRTDAFAVNTMDGGGVGASLGRDGAHGICYPTLAKNVSVELAEMNAPIYYLRRELIPDSCGAGQFRGGLGVRFALAPVPGHDHRVRVSANMKNLRAQPAGIAGGSPGSFSRLAINGEQLPTTSGPAVEGLVHPVPKTSSRSRRAAEVGMARLRIVRGPPSRRTWSAATSRPSTPRANTARGGGTGPPLAPTRRPGWSSDERHEDRCRCDQQQACRLVRRREPSRCPGPGGA